MYEELTGTLFMKRALQFIFSLFLLTAISTESAAQCNTPANLRVIAYGPDFITVDWDNTTASSFEYRFVAQGGSLNLATINTTSAKPIKISGLNSITTYFVQVREVCTGGNPWPSAASASTSCPVVNPPFTTNFNGNAWQAGATNASGSINACWQRDATTGYIWKPGPPQFVSNFTGAQNDFTGSGKYMMIDQISFPLNTSDSAELYSPLYDLGTLTNPQLSFWYHMFGADIEDLRVYITNDFGASYSLLQTISGPQQSSNTDAWKESIINLGAYANDTIRLKFQAVEQSVGFQNAVCIDEVKIAETPSCPKPSNLSLVFAGFNQATFSWTSGGASNWQMSYGSPGFSPNSGTIVGTSSNPGTLSGLSANTNYEVYVRDSCGASDVSDWIGPLAFRTACTPLSTPYSENFDANGFTTSPTFNGLGNINSCWQRSPLTPYAWKTGPPLFSPTNTGPSGDNTTGSAQYMYTETIAGGFSLDSTVLTGPLVDLGGLTNPELKFYVHMFGFDIDQLKVYINNGGGWQLINTQNGSQQSSKTEAWKEVIVSLSSYVNDTIRLQFVGKRSNGFAADIALDDISIDEAPNCPKPQNLNAISIGYNSVNLGWQSGGASNWNISYGTPGSTASNGTIVSANSNPFTLTGLSANTSYDIWVRDSCGPGDVSVWNGPLSITTTCLPISTPYFENFDGSDFAPGTFTVAGTLNSCFSPEVNVNYQWSVEDGAPGTFNAGANNDHTTGTGQYIFTQALFSAALSQVTETELISPLYDLSPLSSPELRFWYHMFGVGIDSLAVHINDGSGFNYLWSVSGQQQNAGNDPWLEAIVSLGDYVNDTVTLKFIGYRNSPFSNQAPISIDDLRIDETPNCPEPSNFVVNGSGPNSINLAWTSGGATNWQIEYGPVGFSPGSGTIVNANTNPFTLSGLSPNTPYQIYVRDSCGINDVSFWTGPVNARTSCTVATAPYFENFDNGSWTDPTLFNDPGDIDPCWSRNDTSGYFWRGNQGATDGFNSGPTGDHTTGNDFYVYAIREGAFGTQLSTDLVTIPVDLDTLSTPELRFWYHMFGIDIDKLVISINNGSGWTNLNTISGQQQSSSAAAWNERIISLSAYTGDTVQIRFRAFRTTTFGLRANISIDDIRIDNAPTCPQPSNVSITGSTPTSIDVSWTSGGATNWQIQYRQSGSGSAFTVVNANTNPFTLNGLNPSTNYEVLVRDSCSANDVSWWTGPIYGSTACGVTSLPFSENFDGPDWQEGINFFNQNDQISACWSRNRQNNNDKWGTGTGTTPSFNTGPLEDVQGSGNYIYFESDFSSQNNPAVIRSPEIALINSSGAKLYYSYHMFGNNINSLQVRLNTNQSGNNILLRTWTNQQQNSSGASWKVDSIDLSAYVGDTVKVIFRAVSIGGQGDIAVDEVSILPIGPSCGVPFNLQLTNSTYSSLSFSWSNSNIGASTTTLRWYDAALGPGTATVVPNVSSPYSINGLNSSSDYVTELFDSCGTVVSTSLTDTLSTLFCPPVTAGFTLNDRFLRRDFTSTSTNADTLIWDFGTGDSSNALNPVYHYDSAGTYTVILIAANGCGNSDTLVQIIEVCDTLRANFTWQQTNDSTRFTADPGNHASGYFWELGNGTTGSGSTAAAFYSDTLDKSVTLTSWNACGDTVRNTRTVEACDPPKADWTYTILPPVSSGLRVQFDGTISTGASSYSWDFGDGNTGTGPTPIHIYATPGLFYEVTLNITGVCGESTRKFKLNEIGLEEIDLPQAQLYPNPVSEILTIEWNEEKPSVDVFLIYSSTGQLMMKIPYKKQEQLDLSGLSPGFYRLIIKGDFGELPYSFVKD